jgi:hypothetical protein
MHVQASKVALLVSGSDTGADPLFSIAQPPALWAGQQAPYAYHFDGRARLLQMGFFILGRFLRTE